MIQGGDFVKGDGTGLCLKCGLGRQSLASRLRGDALVLQFPEFAANFAGLFKELCRVFLESSNWKHTLFMLSFSLLSTSMAHDVAFP